MTNADSNSEFSKFVSIAIEVLRFTGDDGEDDDVISAVAAMIEDASFARLGPAWDLSDILDAEVNVIRMGGRTRYISVTAPSGLTEYWPL